MAASIFTNATRIPGEAFALPGQRAARRRISGVLVRLRSMLGGLVVRYIACSFTGRGPGAADLFLVGSAAQKGEPS